MRKSNICTYSDRDDEYTIVKAYRISNCWAAYKQAGIWNITHVPTGGRLTYAYRLKDAQTVCIALDKLNDWQIDAVTVREMIRNVEEVRKVLRDAYKGGLIYPIGNCT